MCIDAMQIMEHTFSGRLGWVTNGNYAFVHHAHEIHKIWTVASIYQFFMVLVQIHSCERDSNHKRRD